MAPLPLADGTDVHRELSSRFGVSSNDDALVATLLNVPEMAEAVLPMTRYISEASTVARAESLMLGLRTAWLEGSGALWATYANDAFLIDPEIVERSVARPDEADAAARQLLELADDLVGSTSVSESTWTALSDGHDRLWMMDAVETGVHVAFLACLARSFGVGAPSGEVTTRQALRREPTLLAKARIEPIEGPEIAVHRTFARHPALNAARQPRSTFVNKISRLSDHDRETLILRIGWDCQAEYEWAKHVGSVGRARDHGIDPDLVAAGPTAPGLSERDAILLRVADDLYEDSMVSDETWKALREHYDLAGAMSAVFTASSYRSTAMSLNAYGVQLEPGDETFPLRSG